MALKAPTHHITAMPGEIAKTVIMPGDPLRAKFIAENFLENVKQVNEVRCMYAYTGTYKGKELTVMAHGIGAPSMGVHAFELYSLWDVENIIRVGTCGAIRPEVQVYDMIMATGAHYNTPYADQYGLNGHFSACATYSLLRNAVEKAEGMGITPRVGTVYSTDIFYGEDDAKSACWAKMGALAVEMEIAALYIVAARLGKNALGILTVSDSLVTDQKTSALERQNSFTDMMKVALETAITL